MFRYLSDLTQDQLKQALSYDPLTGLWVWLIDAGQHIKIGDLAGGLNKDGYLVIGLNGKVYRAHRLAHLYMTGKWPDGEVDHENRLRNDCTWDNIRKASRQQNMRNATVKSNNKCGIKGIRKKNNKWESRIKVNGKAIHLGYFKTSEEAHTAYVTAANLYFGEFATSGKSV